MTRRFWFSVIVLVALLIGSWMIGTGTQLRLVPNRSAPPMAERYRQPQDLSPAFELAGGPERTGRGFPQREILDLASEFPGLVFNRGPADVKMVALTFDDGPDSLYTPKILDILQKHKVKATFFVIGKRVEVHQDIVQRMVREGHIVGNHSWSHPNLLKLDRQALEKEITQTENLLLKEIGYRTALFRSPYGSLDRQKVREVEALGYKIIAWNVDSLDWKGLTGEQVRFNILENVRQGSIVLQHSAGGPGEDLSGTVEALPVVIQTLMKEGYSFVTIPELLGVSQEK
ncbi:MAG: polysaccharide deacetylase family protein [Clostridia bacterium]|nr:polysaccharide deacetylase family protein [Clostridia bacterium]